MQPSVGDNARWWLWPTILSLDAPVVAVLWQRVIAGGASVRTEAPEAFVLGSSVWLAYTADRWIEGWRLVPGNIATHRHRFYQRWRWPIAGAWVAVVAADAAVAFRGLPGGELRAGALLLLPVVLYLFSHQLVHRRNRWRPPKEACVAGLLAGGAAVFAAGRPGAALPGMAIPFLLFALLCFSNCTLISVWEKEVDRLHGQTSLALQFTRVATVATALPWSIAALSAGLLAAGEKPATAAACAASSGILLGIVAAAEGRVGRVRARVLADLALATPVIPLFLGSLR